MQVCRRNLLFLDTTVKKLLFTINLLVLLFALPINAAPRATEGLLDLRDWSFTVDGPIDLAGEWEFHWRNLPIDLQQSLNVEPAQMIQVPGFWNELAINSSTIPEDGYATYRINILVADRKDLALKFLSVGTNFTFWVDGVEQARVGQPGKTIHASKPRYAPQIIAFTPTSNRVEIMIGVSNFHHRNAGIWEVVKMGKAQDLRDQRESKLVSDLLLFGAIIMMALYNLCMWLLRREFAFGLYLGCFCILMATRILLVGERYVNQLAPGLNWEVLTRLEYVTWFLAIPMFYSFLRSLFHDDTKVYISRLLWIIGISTTVFGLLLPIKLATEIVPLFQGVTVVAMILAVWTIISAITQKRDGSILMGIGCAFLFVTGINDIIVTNEIYDDNLKLQLGLFIFVLAQSVLVSIRFARATQTVDIQTSELQSNATKLTTQEKLRAAAESRTNELTGLAEDHRRISSLSPLVRRELSMDTSLPNGVRSVLEKLIVFNSKKTPLRTSSLSDVLRRYQKSLLASKQLTETKPEIKIEFEQEASYVEGSQSALMTLVDSLVRYAIDAQSSDSAILLSGQRINALPQNLMDKNSGNQVQFVLRLQDDGTGISQQDLLEANEELKQFDPDRSYGTLTELMIAWSIVEELHHAVDVESGKGYTRISFYFPIVARS